MALGYMKAYPEDVPANLVMPVRTVHCKFLLCPAVIFLLTLLCPNPLEVRSVIIIVGNTLIRGGGRTGLGYLRACCFLLKFILSLCTWNNLLVLLN